MATCYISVPRSGCNCPKGRARSSESVAELSPVSQRCSAEVLESDPRVRFSDLTADNFALYQKWQAKGEKDLHLHECHTHLVCSC